MTVSPEAPVRRPRDTTINYGPARPMPREVNDWYVEPREAVEALLRVERFSGMSWDPACGMGTIPKVMLAAGLECWASDIIDRGYSEGSKQDFLDPDDAPGSTGCFANIITNPPFKLAREFIDKALAIASHKVAMLLPLTFLEGQRKAAWLQSKPLARVHVFSWRISMPPGELLVAGKVKATGGKKCFAWFVFEHGWRGPAHVGVLVKGERA